MDINQPAPATGDSGQQNPEDPHPPDGVAPTVHQDVARAGPQLLASQAPRSRGPGRGCHSPLLPPGTCVEVAFKVAGTRGHVPSAQPGRSPLGPRTVTAQRMRTLQLCWQALSMSGRCQFVADV